MRKKFIGIAISLCVGLIGAAQANDAATAAIPIAPARTWKDPTHHMMLGAAHAGSRIVAVGAHGIVLLSDDEGKTYRQARTVPVSSTLSDVYFADASHGWAVGQWGVIIATDDGGETWKLQRSDTSTDQPLFSVYFSDAHHGWAVGLWSLMLRTDDGGQHWSVARLSPPPGRNKADLNLFRIFADRSGTLFVAAEQGFVLRSRDGGVSWEYLKTGGKGSLWAGTVAADGTLFVGGLLGHLYASRDEGGTWAAVDTGTDSSITDLATAGDRVFGVGLDGLTISGQSNAQRFVAKHRQDRQSLTAVVFSPTHTAVSFSQDGLVGR
ncbi:WD40/YVTN/BNR-like repeat-containing protein [Trinickia dinghuensis]|uniref:Glycosyl hydrolase n=1 Tax=Trinickia dinghuensis TaxID=2291023 RepID=A0A3D8JUH6_9BURK|nr:YCF48-related protein [Trinickia dinghuensis]RDU96244.1 glycosyl hydrolase [Trinickia dinghuensis]